MLSSVTYALRDIVDGFLRLPIAWSLAHEDLRDRYRRSYIGLAWVVVSFIGFILVKQLIFAQLFQVDGYDFLSHLVIGFALFTFVSTVIPGGAGLFNANRTWILSSNLPYTLYVNKLILQSFIELGLLTISATILLLLWGDLHPSALWTIPPALLLYYLSAYGTCLLLAPIGARVRDSVYAIQTVMRMLFFATPIVWLPTPGTLRAEIARWNPFTYYLDIIRMPLMNGDVSTQSWLIVTGITGLLLIAGFVAFTIARKKVAYWI